MEGSHLNVSLESPKHLALAACGPHSLWASTNEGFGLIGVLPLCPHGVKRQALIGGSWTGCGILYTSQDPRGTPGSHFAQSGRAEPKAHPSLLSHSHTFTSSLVPPVGVGMWATRARPWQEPRDFTSSEDRLKLPMPSPPPETPA